jgi:hypothetical protein
MQRPLLTRDDRGDKAALLATAQESHSGKVRTGATRAHIAGAAGRFVTAVIEEPVEPRTPKPKAERPPKEAGCSRQTTRQSQRVERTALNSPGR